MNHQVVGKEALLLEAQRKNKSPGLQTERLARLSIFRRDRVRFSEPQADEAVPPPESRFFSHGWHHWLHDGVSPAALEGIAAKWDDLERDRVNATTCHLREKSCHKWH